MVLSAWPASVVAGPRHHRHGRAAGGVGGARRAARRSSWEAGEGGATHSPHSACALEAAGGLCCLMCSGSRFIHA